MLLEADVEGDIVYCMSSKVFGFFLKRVWKGKEKIQIREVKSSIFSHNFPSDKLKFGLPLIQNSYYGYILGLEDHGGEEGNFFRGNVYFWIYLPMPWRHINGLVRVLMTLVGQNWGWHANILKPV